MKVQPPKDVTLAIIILLAGAGALAAADAADPFGGGAPAAGAKPAGEPFGPAAAGPAAVGGAADPFGGAKPAAPEAAKKAEAGPIAADEKNPVVLAIRDLNPTTPKDLMFAVQSLLENDRPDEAKSYLAKLIAAQPDRDQLEAIQREYGTGFFMRLARDQRMQPDGAQLAKAVEEAAYQAARDPARLKTLIQQLSDPSPLVHQRAVEDLQRAGDAVVPPLLEALADPSRQAEHPRIRQGIVELGEPLVEPMLGALETPDEALRLQVLQVLARFGTGRAVPFLLAPTLDAGTPEAARRAAAETLARIVGAVPSRHEAVQYLFRRVRDYLNGASAGPVDYQDQTVFWHWDPTRKTAVPRRYSAAEASRMMAARLSRDLYKLAMEEPDVRRVFLLANLTQAKIDGGLNRPLPRGDGTIAAQAAALGPAALEDVLAYAIQNDYVPAAIAAAELLKDVGDETLVRSADGQPRPLVSALRHSDRRLRLEAAETIMKFDPSSPYAGSSYLPETFGYFVRTVGSRRALVSHPREDQAQTLIGILVTLGYSADAALSGKETFRLAAKNPDYEFVLISDAADFPDANETIQMFRKDPLTRRLPIGLMARQENLRHAEAMAELDPLLVAFPRPHDEKSMSFQISRLMAAAGHALVGYDERLDQAGRALDHLTRLGETQQERAFYDLFRTEEAVRSALSVPELSAKAARLLGLLGTPEVQRALVTLASQHARPLAERQAAAAAFAQAVERRGLLLTRDEILLQYDRYNRSAALDSGTQQVLAAVLNAIEMPARLRLGKEGLTQDAEAPQTRPN